MFLIWGRAIDGRGVGMDVFGHSRSHRLRYGNEGVIRLEALMDLFCGLNDHYVCECPSATRYCADLEYLLM